MTAPLVEWNADLYDAKHAFVFKFGEDLVDLLNPQVGESILDVGCGTGYLSQLIAGKGATVSGIDSSAEMVAKAKSSYPGLSFETADITTFKSGHSFDAIFSNAVLHWVLKATQAAENMYQLLKPGGRLVLEMGGRNNVTAIVGALQEELRFRGYVENAEQSVWYFPSVGEYSSLLEKVGFRVVYARHYDRETELSDAGKGISDWIQMFGRYFFKNIQQKEVNEISLQVQERLKPTHFREQKWFADYKRLRIIAIKE